MNTAILIADNQRMVNSAPPTGFGAKGAAESQGDESLQRFAEVLPIAQAAMEQTPHGDVSAKAPSKDHFAKRHDDAKTSIGAERLGRRGEKSPTADMQTAWSLTGVVHPFVLRHAVSTSTGGQVAISRDEQQGAKTTNGNTSPIKSQRLSAGRDGETLVTASSRTRTTLPIHQAAVTQPPEMIGAAAAPVTQGAVSQGRSISSVVLTEARRGSTAGFQTARETAGESVPPAGAVGKQAGRSEVRPEASPLTASSASKAVPSASPGIPGQDASLTIGAKNGSDLLIASEKPSQSSVKSVLRQGQQVVGSSGASSSERNVSTQGSGLEGNPSGAIKTSSTARSDHPKSEPLRSEGKEGGWTGTKDGGTAGIEFRMILSGESVTTAPRVPSSSQNAVNFEMPTIRTTVQSVGEQILDSIRSSGVPGEREVLIRLQPPELGTVVVRFQEQGENLTGTLEVGTREAQREIEQALPQVIRGLQEAGIQIRRVEIVTSEQPDRNLGGEHLSQDTWQQREGAGQGHENSSTPQARWPQGPGEPSSVRQGVSPEQAPQIFSSRGRIDVLL